MSNLEESFLQLTNSSYSPSKEGNHSGQDLETAAHIPSTVKRREKGMPVCFLLGLSLSPLLHNTKTPCLGGAVHSGLGFSTSVKTILHIYAHRPTQCKQLSLRLFSSDFRFVKLTKLITFLFKVIFFPFASFLYFSGIRN